MKTKINLEILKKHKPREPILGWFEEHFKNETVTIAKILQKMREVKLSEDYMFWFFEEFSLTDLCQIWHPNGKVKEEANYKNGKPEGLYRRWHCNGMLWEEVNYKNGELEGLYRCWYSDGKLWEEENFKNGKREGLYQCWYPDGQLEEEVNYKNGKIAN